MSRGLRSSAFQMPAHLGGEAIGPEQKRSGSRKEIPNPREWGKALATPPACCCNAGKGGILLSRGGCSAVQ